MKKNYFLLLFLLGITPMLFAQKIAHTDISQTNVNLRGAPVKLGQVTLQAPAAGKIILRFDGHCLSAEGDRIFLAASQTSNYGPNDESVELEAANADVNSNAFSHTRAYDVGPGEHTFYALAENAIETDGNGFASVYGQLVAEWFPEEPGKAF